MRQHRRKRGLHPARSLIAGMLQPYASESRALSPYQRTRGALATVAGLAIVYDVLTPAPVGTPARRERVARGACARYLATHPYVVAMIEHDRTRTLADTTSGTLRLEEDALGLAFELDLIPGDLARQVDMDVRAARLWGCSFGFLATTTRARLDVLPGGEQVRTVLEVQPHEITLTGRPAYSQTKLRFAPGAYGFGPEVDARRVSLLAQFAAQARNADGGADARRRRKLADLEQSLGL